MSELKSTFLDEMKKALKRANLDIFSILFIVDILGYFFVEKRRSIFGRNYFIQITLSIFKQFFNNKMFLIISIIGIIMILVILVMVEKEISLPSQTFVSGKVIGYSCSAALGNLSYLLYYYVYSLNIVYISMLIWFNSRNNLNKLSNAEYILIVVDILILVFKLIRSTFQYNYKIEFKKEIDDEYFDVSYFVLAVKKIDYCTDIMILKDRIMQNHAFYVAKKQKTYNRSRLYSISFYTILNNSLDFKDIQYSYEYWAETLMKNSTQPK